MIVDIVSNMIKGTSVPDGTYTLDKEGTNKQNALFHALLQEWYASGCYSYSIKNFYDLKNCVKRSLGAGFDCYYWVHNGGLKKTKECPPMEQADIIHGAPQVMGKLKSWSKYTKSERQRTIDLLIKEMINSGVNSKKFDEILSGVQS